MPQFLRLPSMQAGRDGEGGIHAYYSGIEIEFGHAFEAARGTLFNADAASFAIVHENLVAVSYTHLDVYKRQHHLSSVLHEEE